MRQATLVGIEACATAHHWARELTKLGHRVRLMPASYVKAYVKRSKHDAADAAAVCEAVTRPSMRFVPVKTIDQQAALMLHRCRDLLIRQRTQLINALRAHLAHSIRENEEWNLGRGRSAVLTAVGSGTTGTRWRLKRWARATRAASIMGHVS